MTSVFVLNPASVALKWGSRCMRDGRGEPTGVDIVRSCRWRGSLATGVGRPGGGLDTSKRGRWAPLGVQSVKSLPSRQETGVRSLGREDPLEEGTATHSSTLAWRIPWTEEPGGLQSIGSQRIRHD